MNKRVSIELDPEAVGEAFACTDDEAQYKMLNEMATELKTHCAGHYPEMQLVAISKGLNKDAQNMIKSLSEFIDLRKNEDIW